MKALKLNLLEKKEMSTVRGGDIYSPCGCHCWGPNGGSYNTESIADGSDDPTGHWHKPWATSLHNETNYINGVAVRKK